MSGDNKQATSSGARDLAIIGVILLVLLGGIGLIVSAVVREMGGEPEAEEPTEVAEETVKTVEPVREPTVPEPAAPEPVVPAPVEPERAVAAPAVPEPAAPDIQVAKAEPVRVSEPVQTVAEPAPPAPAEPPPRRSRSRRVTETATVVVKEPAAPAAEVNPPPTPIDPRLAAALGDLAGDDEMKVVAAISTLRRFSKESAAFDALCKTAMGGGSDNVKVQAMRALVYFKDFNAGPVCISALRARDEQIVKTGIDLAGALQFAGSEVVFTDALKSRSANIRRHALRGIQRYGIIKADKHVSRLARYDPVKTVKDQALTTLCGIKSSEALPMLRNMLAGQDKAGKYRAVNYLRGWQGDAEALDLLYRYRNDRDVGQQIQQHLARYGR